MEDIKIAMLGLLSRVQKDLNCVAKNDISDAVRELYNINERNEKAFAQREKALLELTSKKANLEDVFLELTESGMDTVAADKNGKVNKLDIKPTENNDAEWMERQVDDK